MSLLDHAIYISSPPQTPPPNPSYIKSLDLPDDSICHTAYCLLGDNRMLFVTHMLKDVLKNIDKAKNPTSNHPITPSPVLFYKCKIHLTTCLCCHYSWRSLVCSTRLLWLVTYNGLSLHLYKNIHIMMSISRTLLLQLNFLCHFIFKLPISHVATVLPPSKFQELKTCLPSSMCGNMFMLNCFEKKKAWCFCHDYKLLNH